MTDAAPILFLPERKIAMYLHIKYDLFPGQFMEVSWLRLLLQQIGSEDEQNRP
jgi:hypothetical protein